MGIRLAVLAVTLFALPLSIGQAATPEITNSDVVSMVRAGIGDQTIILAIQRGPVKFDTSPQALITLKSGGVSDQVLNAILTDVVRKGQISAQAQETDAQPTFQKALDAIGPHQKVMAIHSIRWSGHVSGSTASFERQIVKVLPDKTYVNVKTASGQSMIEVVTPDYNYRISGKMTTSVSPPDLDAIRDQSEFDTLQIAQHPDEYVVSLIGEGQVGSISAVQLQIGKSGKSIIWEIDSQTGRLISTRSTTPAGNVTVEFSDWRVIDGVYVSFKRHVTQPQGISDLIVGEFEINPVIDEELFQRPNQALSQGITLKVLQAQSVPYIQQSGGGISTNCSIVGSANTSGYTNTVGNSTYGDATTSSNQHMNCNSYDTSVRWPHVLNVIFGEASDGNSYMFACDRAWRWSKCTSLRVGQIFNARFTDKGLEVEAFNTKGKEKNPTYHVLQSKALQ